MNTEDRKKVLRALHLSLGFTMQQNSKIFAGQIISANNPALTSLENKLRKAIDILEKE